MSAFDGYVRPIVEYYQYAWSPTLYCDTDLVKNVKRSYMWCTFLICSLLKMS